MAIRAKGKAHVDYRELRERAAVIFVDRDEPKRIFRDAMDELAREPNRIHFLSFYGVGGQGKTALFHEFCRLLRANKGRKRIFRCAPIDLHFNRLDGEVHCWVLLRNAISAATGAKFPCFDFAYADYMQQTRPEAPPATLGASRLASLRGGHGDDIGAGGTNSATEVVKSSFSDIAAGFGAAIPLFGPLMQRGVKWAVVKGYEKWLVRNKSALDRLYNGSTLATAAEIEKMLPEILAHELALHQSRHEDQRLVLLIDEYENAMPGGGALSPRLALGKGSWDRGLRQFLQYCDEGSYQPTNPDEDGYDYSAALLLVILGREKILWDQLQERWRVLLHGRQHLLEGLSDADAEDYLIQAKIGDEAIREAIIGAARVYDPDTRRESVYPIMLDLAKDIFFTLKQQGKTPMADNFAIGGRSYSEKRRELLSRFMRNYPPEYGQILRRLACAREFDRPLTDHLAEKHARAFNMEQFDLLTGLSFLTLARDGRGWLIHQHIRDTLLEDLPEAERRATHVTLMHWFHRRSTAPTFREVTLAHAESLGDFVVHAAASDLGSEDRPELNEMQRFVRDHPLAPPLLRQSALDAVALHRQTRPLGHPDIADDLSFLGAVLIGLRDYERARDVFEEAVIIRRRSLPTGHPGIAKALNGLGAALWSLEKHKRARETFEEVLAIRRETLPGDHPDLADILYNLSASLYALRDFEGARQTNEEALAIRRKVLAADHPDVANSLHGLAISFSELGDNAAAVEAFEESLLIRRRALPDDHPDIAQSLSGLAIARHALADHKQAAAAFEEALAIRRRVLPPDHAEIPENLDLLGIALRVLNEHDRARAAFEEALAIRRRTLGTDHPDLADNLDQLGASRFAVLDLGGARAAHEEALAIRRATVIKRRRLLPPDHPEVHLSEAALAASEQNVRLVTEAEFGWRARPVSNRSSSAAPWTFVEPAPPWPLPPPLNGAWRECDRAVAEALAAAIDQRHRLGPDTSATPFCIAHSVRRFRSLALPFWGDDWQLAEGLAEPDGQTLTFLVLLGPPGACLALGDAGAIYDRNALRPCDFSSAEKRLAYLRFFCSWMRGPGGRFAWIESTDDLTPFVADLAKRRELLDHCAPPAGAKRLDSEGRWRASATLVHGDALFRSTFTLGADGRVDMVKDMPLEIGEGVIAAQQWVGPFAVCPR